MFLAASRIPVLLVGQTSLIHNTQTATFYLLLTSAPFEFDFEDAQLDEQAVRDLVWEEMR